MININFIDLFQHALKMKRKNKKKRQHWLDNADDKFSRDLIADVKILLKVLFMYIPLPVFWALFDQQVCYRTCHY